MTLIPTHFILSATFMMLFFQIKPIAVQQLGRYSKKQALGFTSELSSVPLELNIRLVDENVFLLALHDENEGTNSTFQSPIYLELLIGDKRPILLDPETSDTTHMMFLNENPRYFEFDQVSIPSANSGTYAMTLNQTSRSDGYSVASETINVQIGCSLPEFQDCTSCILNCGTWKVEW